MVGYLDNLAQRRGVREQVYALPTLLVYRIIQLNFASRVCAILKPS